MIRYYVAPSFKTESDNLHIWANDQIQIILMLASMDN